MGKVDIWIMEIWKGSCICLEILTGWWIENWGSLLGMFFSRFIFTKLAIFSLHSVKVVLSTGPLRFLLFGSHRLLVLKRRCRCSSVFGGVLLILVLVCVYSFTSSVRVSRVLLLWAYCGHVHGLEGVVSGGPRIVVVFLRSLLVITF